MAEGTTGERLERLASAGAPVLPLVPLTAVDEAGPFILRWSAPWPAPKSIGLAGPIVDQAGLDAAIDEANAQWWSAPALAERRALDRPDGDGPCLVLQSVTEVGGSARHAVVISHDLDTGEPGPFASMSDPMSVDALVDVLVATAPIGSSPGPVDDAALIGAVNRSVAALRGPVRVDAAIVDDTVHLFDAQPLALRARGACRVAVDLHRDADVALSRAEAIQLISAADVDEIMHPQFVSDGSDPITVGLGASPGAAVGLVYFSADEAADAYDEGHDVILVQQETTPEDVHGMEVAEGILTTKGGLASHAAVVARGWGKPAVCGAEALRIGDRSFSVGDTVVREGDVISIDGSTGEVFLGDAEVAHAPGSDELDRLLGWADEIRAGHLAVRANADTAEDAEIARRFGAEGIGLCRTEHQFLGDRLPAMRRMILAADRQAELAALAELELLQRRDFERLLSAMSGLPVTIRLLDPPLHEFLPDPAGEAPEIRAAVEAWSEVNPMLGTRGVRLGVLRADLYRMQARAVAGAVAALADRGQPAEVEILIPLVINDAETRLIRTWCLEEVGHLGDAVTIGVMIETPRAALCAAEVAAEADFFSFGTNDLTQMALGFSRDDVESRLMSAYLDRHLLAGNPFESLDLAGVGRLVARAVEEGRASKPELKIGVCGEHGGDAASIAFFHAAGVDYVSCSPYRVPRARLAAAQAVARAT